jgi:leader peptidase (prepilin peptidase)/N-methyltransferase
VALALVLIAIAIYDQATLRIPDILVLLALPPSIAAAMLRGDFLTSALGALVTSGTLWVIAKLYLRHRGQSGLGMGDVKLVAALCFWTGAMGAAPALAIACGLALILLRLQDRAKHEPAAFGPFLAVSFWCVGLVENAQWVS